MSLRGFFLGLCLLCLCNVYICIQLDETYTTTLRDKLWFLSMKDPCVIRGEDSPLTQQISNLPTSAVLNITNREPTVNMVFRGLTKVNRQLNEYMIEDTTNCVDNTLDNVWNLLYSLNSTDLSLSLVYRMNLLLAASYRVMAEDWDLGIVCRSRLDSYNKTRAFVK